MKPLQLVARAHVAPGDVCTAHCNPEQPRAGAVEVQALACTTSMYRLPGRFEEPHPPCLPARQVRAVVGGAEDERGAHHAATRGVRGRPGLRQRQGPAGEGWGGVRR